jgi:uncharacterized protein YdbL (DUF1318 family)
MRRPIMIVIALTALSLCAPDDAEAKTKRAAKKMPTGSVTFVGRSGGGLAGSVGTQRHGYIYAISRRDEASQFFTRQMLNSP